MEAALVEPSQEGKLIEIVAKVEFILIFFWIKTYIQLRMVPASWKNAVWDHLEYYLLPTPVRSPRIEDHDDE